MQTANYEMAAATEEESAAEAANYQMAQAGEVAGEAEETEKKDSIVMPVYEEVRICACVGNVVLLLFKHPYYPAHSF